MLVPFLVVSLVMIFGFSFTFYINRFDDEGCDPMSDEEASFCTISDSMLTTLNYFYSGPDDTGSWWLDQLFGLVAVVILLNVVIAVVSDAWEESQKLSAQAFWEFRVNFLFEVNSISTTDGVEQLLKSSIVERKSRRTLNPLQLSIQDDITHDDGMTTRALSEEEEKPSVMKIFLRVV